MKIMASVDRHGLPLSVSTTLDEELAARIGCAKGEFMAFLSMTGLAVLVAIAGTVLASCADISHKIVDTIPEWAGGMPKNVPPRPGTPEYDEWMEQQQAEAARDKSKDPPKPKTEAEPKIAPIGGSF